jgi:hypothetical protein
MTAATKQQRLTTRYPMNRRELMVTYLAAAALACVTTRVGAGDGSAAPFVRQVYEREIERHNKRQRPHNDSFYALFTHEMRELMNAPRRPDPNALDGPILHALFGRGAMPGREVVLGKITTVREDAAAATVNVALTVFGNRRTVILAMLRQDGTWRVNDIDYGDGETLSGRHKRAAGR